MRDKPGFWRRIVVAAAVAAALMAFPQSVRAAESRFVDVFYVEFDREGEAFFASEQFEVCGGLDGDILLWVRFANLLENANKGKVPCVTAGTRLLDVRLEDGTLYVNASRELLGYGGGAGNERLLLGQLVRNAQAVAGAFRLTLLVEGAAPVMPEGSLAANITLAEWRLY